MTERTCPVPLGGRNGPACNQPAPHRVRGGRAQGFGNYPDYHVCCDHAPGPEHVAEQCPLLHAYDPLTRSYTR